MYGCLASIHKEDRYANEPVALPENVLKHFRKAETVPVYRSSTGVKPPPRHSVRCGHPTDYGLLAGWLKTENQLR
jgi:hypothetical protein